MTLRISKGTALLVLLPLLACCSTNPKQYAGPERPASDLVTVYAYPVRVDIKIGDEWVEVTGANNLQPKPQKMLVLPGSYRVRQHFAPQFNFMSTEILETDFTAVAGDSVKIEFVREGAQLKLVSSVSHKPRMP